MTDLYPPRLIPFKKEHLEVMDVREHEMAVLGFSDHISNLEKSSIAITGITDGRVICCGGVMPFGTGNAEVWLIPSIWVSKYPIIFQKTLKKWLLNVRNDLALTRMQTACINDDMHNNWMQNLGFEREGLMRNYFNGVDYAMFGRTIWQ